VNQKPIYLLAGGRGSRKTREIYRAFYETIGKTAPVIAYVGAASGDERLFFSINSRMLKQAGAGKVNLAFTVPKNADIQKAQEVLNSADAVFVSGGDVEAGMQVLEQKKMAGFLSELYRNGKPFFGSSAGSIILAKEWVRWSDPNDASTAEIFPCLGLAPVLCDTHGEDGDWEELKALLKLEKEGTIGYGIASDTSLKVFPDGKVEAMGGPVCRFVRRAVSVGEIAALIPED
jgi:peptidase E